MQKLIIAFILLLASASDASQLATLSVDVTGLRNTQGLLRLSLFQKADGFPEDSRKAARTLSVRPKAQTERVQFRALPKGYWALAVLHDENENGKLDRNLLGIPKEGVGASNNAARFGAPSFDDAKFKLSQDQTLTVELVYWL